MPLASVLTTLFILSSICAQLRTLWSNNQYKAESSHRKDLDRYISVTHNNLIIETVSLPEFEGFDWDQGNVEKNWLAHEVTPQEAEQAAFNRPLIVADDLKHSRTA